MPDEFDLPQMFRAHEDAIYTSSQLEPTIERLQRAVADLSASPVTPQALASAWTRIAELRLPRKAVPAEIVREIEYLVVAWGSHAIGGIAAHAYSLNDEERDREAERIRRMLAAAEAAAEVGPALPLYQSE